MDRGKFITVAALGSPVALAAETRDEPPYEAWWNTVDTPSKLTATTDNDIKLTVELFFPPEDKVKEIQDPSGFTGYTYEGKKLPDRWWNGESILTKFDLSWSGKSIAIDPRFWSDLAGFRIQVSPLKIENIPDKHVSAFLEFLENIRQPRISLSADKGTVLIEWARSEECDGRSMIRWMVSKNGTVLRHRLSHEGC